MLEIIQSYWPLAVVIVVVLAAIKLIGLVSTGQNLPYVRRERLVTAAELRFYRTLQKAVMDDFEIFAMVRLADIVTVPNNTPNRRKWMGKILAKHIDFVLCDPTTLVAKVAIELDDSSHQAPSRRERDEFVNAAFEAAGIPLLRVPVAQKYEAQALRDLIQSKL